MGTETVEPKWKIFTLLFDNGKYDVLEATNLIEAMARTSIKEGSLYHYEFGDTVNQWRYNPATKWTRIQTRRIPLKP